MATNIFRRISVVRQEIWRKGQCCQLSTYNSPNFSNSVIWPFREWSLNPSWPPPILRKKLNKHNSGIWGPVQRFGKVGLLRFYQTNERDILDTPRLIIYSSALIRNLEMAKVWRRQSLTDKNLAKNLKQLKVLGSNPFWLSAFFHPMISVLWYGGAIWSTQFPSFLETMNS